MTHAPSETPDPLREPALADAYLEHLRAGGQETPEGYLAKQESASEGALELLRIVAHFADEEPFTLHAGQVLGPYRIDTQLGSGGMGTVYRATVEEATVGLEAGSHVALKVIHPHLLSRRGFFKRFLREAEVGKRVRHENVVSALDVDATDVDAWVAHYLTMEYVEGRTLRDLVQTSGTVSEALVREIGRQVASGLEAIHAAGVVHRDLKPENVLITDDHRVRIMDLGMARLVEGTAALTREGQFAGTVQYAAPEQFGSEAAGPAADLYALGVVLYELAAGENPFRRDETAGVIRAHLEETPVPLSDRDGEITPFLSALVATLLAKEPTKRLGSAAELHEILVEGEQSRWWAEQEKEIRKGRAELPRVPVRRETKLYGREADLEMLREAWRRAGEGDGNTVLLHGEAGIGKSRLVDAFLSDLPGEDAHVLYGSYPPFGGAGGITDAILEHFGSAELETTLRPYLTVTPTLVPPLAALLKHERFPEDVPSLGGDALHAVLVHLMRGLAAERPLLWVVDDLHFASTDSRKVLLSLARAVEGHRVLLLLTTRPGLPEDELAHFSRLESFQRTEVGRLSPREVIELLRDAFKSEALAEKLGGKIAFKSDGVPFFVFEMIRGLKEGQFITELPDGSYVETQVIEDIEVPSAVRDLVEARLRDLSKEERAILDVGATQGFEFDPDLVARALNMRLVHVLQTLGGLERCSGVVQGTGANYRFDHHQIQEVVYGDLHARLRGEYHTLLAKAFAERDGVNVDDPKNLPGETSFFLAWHHLWGREPSLALSFLEPALVHLTNGFRNEQVITLVNRALEVDGLLGGEARADVLLKKDDCLHLQGRRTEQESVLAEARNLAESSGEKVLMAQVDNAMGRVLLSLGRYEEANSHYELALASRRELGDTDGEAAATINLGTVKLSLGRYQEAQILYEQGRLLAIESCNRRWEANATGNLGAVFHSLGRLKEAQAIAERRLAIARETGDLQAEANAASRLGGVFWSLGRYEEARQCYDRSLAITREIGDRQGEGKTSGCLGLVFHRLGLFEEAKAQYERHLAMAREIGDRQGEGEATGGLGNLLYALGRHEEARQHHERHLAIAHEIGDREGELGATGNLGNVLLTLGRYEGARQCCERSLAIAREIGNRSLEAAAVAGLGNLRTSQGRYEEAWARYKECLAITREIGDLHGEGRAMGNLGVLSYSFGRHEEARGHLERALEIAREIGDRQGEGHALHDIATVADEEEEGTGVLALANDALTLRRDIATEDGIADSLVQVGGLRWRAGDLAAAREALQEAIDLLRQQQRKGELAHARALLACPPGGDLEAAKAALKEAGESGNTPQVRYLLWKATNDPAHLREAKRLLDHLVGHAPVEYRESMRKNVRLHREIESAWKALHPEQAQGVEGLDEEESDAD